MKKTNLYGLIFALVATIFAIGNVEAQNFENNTNGSYRTRSHRGIVRMYGTPANATSGVAENDGAFTGNDRLGSSAAKRIDGTVVWAQKDSQNAQTSATTYLEDGTDGMFYFNLGVANQEYKIFKYANVANTFLRYPDDGTVATTPAFTVDIAHMCDAIFTYDGNGDGTTISGNSVQTVLNSILDGTGSDHDNIYATLRVAKTTSSTSEYAQVVDYVGTRKLDITTTSRLSIQDDAATGAIFPHLIVNAQWIAPTTGATCNLFTSDIYGDLDIFDEGTGNQNPIFTVESQTEILVRNGGSLTNNTEVNTAYDFALGTYAANETGGDYPNAPATIHYETNGGTTDAVMPTTPDNPYGRLVIEGNDDLLFSNNVYVGGHADDAFYFTGTGDLYTDNNTTPQGLADCADALSHAVYQYALVFTEADAFAMLAESAEVHGWMQRNKWFGETQYTWHNSATKFALGDGGTEGDIVEKEFAFEVMPAVNVGSGDPSLAKLASNGTGYINRLFETRIPTGSNGIYMTNILLGFQYTAEVQDTMGASNATDVKWSTVRGFGAWLGQNAEMALLTGQLTAGTTVWGVANSNGTLVADGAQPTADANGYAAMTLKDNAGRINLSADRADQNGSTAISCAQIVFGNQPTVLVSNKNGRWSNPATWGDVYGNDLGITPTAVDSVVIANVVYTGWYEGQGGASGNAGNLFDVDGWGVNEYDLPGVIVGNDVVLAKSVNILSKTDADNRITTTSPGGNDDPSDGMRNTYGVALVIGNGENTLVASTPSDNNPAIRDGVALSAMVYGAQTTGTGAALPNAGVGTPLMFGTIYNYAGTATNSTAVESITVANAKGAWSLGQLTGLIITDGQYSAVDELYRNTVSGPIVNPENMINAGEVINNSVFDVGRQHTANP